MLTFEQKIMNRQFTLQLLWAGLLLPATLLVIGLVLTHLQQLPDHAAVTLPVRPKAASYLERITTFQAEWNKVDEMINDQLLGLYEWEDLVHQTAEAQEAWSAVLAEAPTEAVLSPDQFTRRRFQERREAVTLALHHFDRTLAKADHDEVATASGLVNQEVGRFVSLFADKVKLANRRA